MCGMAAIHHRSLELPAIHAGEWPWSFYLGEELRPVLFLVGPEGEPRLYLRGSALPASLPVGSRGTLQASETDHPELAPTAVGFRAEGEPVRDPFGLEAEGVRSKPGWLLLVRALAGGDPRLKERAREWRGAGVLSGFDAAYFARAMGWAAELAEAGRGSDAGAYELLTARIAGKEWAAAGLLLRDRRAGLDLWAAEIHNLRDRRYRAPVLAPSVKKGKPSRVRMSWAELLEIGTIHESGRTAEAKAAWEAFRKAYPDWEEAFRYGPMEGFEPPLRELWKPDRPEALLRQIGGLWEWLNSGGFRK